MDKSVGARVKEVREDAGLNQKNFGLQVGVSLPTVNRIENGHRAPDSALAVKIAETFDCDLQWLLTGKGSKASLLGTHGVAILNRIPDDFSDIPDDIISGHLSVPGIPDNSWAIQYQGDEMMPAVKPGDYVLFRTGKVDVGQMAIIADKWKKGLVRRLDESMGDRVLITGDPDYPAQPEENTEIIGPVIEVVRRLTF